MRGGCSSCMLYTVCWAWAITILVSSLRLLDSPKEHPELCNFQPLTLVSDKVRLEKVPCSNRVCVLMVFGNLGLPYGSCRSFVHHLHLFRRGGHPPKPCSSQKSLCPSRHELSVSTTFLTVGSILLCNTVCPCASATRLCCLFSEFLLFMLDVQTFLGSPHSLRQGPSNHSPLPVE